MAMQMKLTPIRSALWSHFTRQRWAATRSGADAVASLFRRLIGGEPLDIDKRLSAAVGPAAVVRFRVSSKELPAYRFVDLFRSVELYSRSQDRLWVIESQHDEDLNSLLHG